MADRSLGARLGLAANLLLVTGLALGYDSSGYRPPGVSEAGPPLELYCPSNDHPFGPDGPPCGALLTRPEDTLFCYLHGPIDDNDALPAPPQRS